MNPIQLRKILVQIHLYCAAFLTPAFLLVAVTGGLYLLGVKGSTTTSPLALPAGAVLNSDSPTLEQDVADLLKAAGSDHKFDYVKNRGNVLQTRPTSREYVQFNISEDGVTANSVKPDLQYSLMELHKGHGPTLFRSYQILAAIALFIVVVGGFFVGLLAPAYRKTTIIATGLGAVSFALLAFML
ncbi:hypothetical protein [Hirschia litorea]|uniref:Peptidase n=1 Tax=Hirschia litorea TaxID=1199156 RepID=A0ABW2IJX2_9PROT